MTCKTSVQRASAARLTAGIPLTRELVSSLVPALADNDPLVRGAAAYGLADVALSEQDARAGLISAAKDSVRAVRINAAWALRTADAIELGADADAVNAALAEWRQAALLTADGPESWHTIGIFEAGRGDAQAAETAYRKAISLEPRATPSRYNLALLLVDTGRAGDAKQQLESVVAEDDTFAPAWFALGMIQGEEKDWKAAAHSLGRCLQHDPAYPKVLSELTHAYLEAGVANVARTVLASALEHPAVRVEALAGLLAVAEKTGTRGDAVRAAKALVAEDPSVAGVPRIAALLAEPTGDGSESGDDSSRAETPTGGAVSPAAR